MPNVFDKAERWRGRAAELRASADCMREDTARSSLRSIALSLEEHARKLEEMAVKVRCVRQTASSLAWRRTG